MGNPLTALRADIIGDGRALETPFGTVPLVYADYTASGRAVGRVEDWIRREVLPTYANTHSAASCCGARTTRMFEAARAELRRALNARPDDQLVFCGAGATAAIHKWIDLLDLRAPRALAAAPPTVIIGPYEHHSNELPWRELDCDLRIVPLAADGTLDVDALAALLAGLPRARRLIAAFSAASNVTGIRTDIARVNALIHAHGGLCGWDFAAAAPYVAMDLQAAGGLDAVFFSPHKFLGGPGAPGVLVFDARTIERASPTRAGGGTVTFVSRERHRYVASPTRREEAGTPDIIGAIRAALAMRLKLEIGVASIEARESHLLARALERFDACARIELLGGRAAPRLPILSFRIRHGDGVLHDGFVVTLLNDLFGIQARGGCSCAGRYGHELLGIDEDESLRIEQRVLEDGVGHRPGWIRIGLHYAMDDAVVDYLLTAVELIAAHGAALLDEYRHDAPTGTWQHVAAIEASDALSTAALPAWDACPDGGSATTVPTLQQALAFARTRLAGAGAARHSCSIEPSTASASSHHSTYMASVRKPADSAR